MDLRHAAERIRVLYMDLLPLYDLASFEELADACRCLDLALVRTDLMDLRIERLDAAVVCLKRHRTDLVGPVGKPFRLDKGPYRMRAHELSSVEKGETFLRLKADRFPSHLLPDFSGFLHLSFIQHFSHADQRQAEVGEGSEVAGGTERTLLVDYREDVVVEHFDKSLDRHQLHSRISV